MIGLFVTLAVTAFPPDGHDRRGQGKGEAPSVTVRGTVELTAGDADSAALVVAADKLREVVVHRARSLVDAVAPAWMPGFTRDQVLRRWLGGFDPTQSMRIVECARDEHDHGSLGTSYRTTLRVASDSAAIESALRRLRRAVPAAAKVFAVKCGAVAGFWALLAVLLGWLDRLSRGYMTWRLRLVGAAAGIGLPAIVLLIL